MASVKRFSGPFPRGAGAAIFLLCLSPLAPAVTISYQATDLADTSPGQDIWLYSYSVSGFAFEANQGFSVFFDRTAFTLLQSLPAFVNPGWDVLSVQPDLALNSDGFYDALAIQVAPSLADPFTIEFVWLGTGVPGSQPLTIYDTDFSTLVEGRTTEVPEPKLAGILACALGSFFSRRYRSVILRRHPYSTACDD